ncbi:class F sortase [Amycolatopsis nigrescens]|uniref:class F sortase n=1 Tax=Amycolatopsis nigrescens TaxID=381445 RepID=UPI00146F7416|nr:class F sortase [Amycolatopsis nigrescens]
MTSPRTAGRHGRTLAAVLLLGLVSLAGCGSGGSGGSDTAPAAPPRVDPPAAVPTPAERPEPAAVDVPKIGAHSTLVPLGLNPDNTIEVPPVTQPMQAGWYSYGPAPGETGPAVILGHVDGDKQPGIFYRLKEMAPGDAVRVSRKDGSSVDFVVRRVEQVDKDEFPTDAVYGDTAAPELRLITCGGGFDRTVRSYRDNIIVYAALA